MRRFVLGTAGHVDHGKTTLVRALTGVDTDRLPEEKSRGITIELGFAPYHLDDDLELSIIDVPGHRRLVHTMIAGAAGMEAVLLVIAADEGVMPQTREHLAVIELLGIRHVVVALTKLDRVGRELAELAAEEARELLQERFAVDVVPCSAVSGEGLEDLRDALRRMLRTLEKPAPAEHPRLSIDRAFSVKGAGTVVTGTLVEGAIKAGESLRLLTEGHVIETAARGLHVHDQSVKQAVAPTRLAINLASVAVDDFHRGDVLTSHPAATGSRILDVELVAEEPLRKGQTLQLYIGTAKSTARVSRVFEAEVSDEAAQTSDPDASPPPTFARLRLHRPIVAFGGDRYVLRGSNIAGPAGAVVGGGRVLDAHAPSRRPKKARAELLAALQRSDEPAAISWLCQEAAPRSVSPEALGARFPLSERAMVRAADKLVDRGELSRTKNKRLVDRAAIDRMIRAVRQQVIDHLREHPLDRGLALETLRSQLAARSDEEVAAVVLKLAARPGGKGSPIVVEGDIVRASGDTPADTEVVEIVEKARRLLRESGLKGVTENAAKEALGAPVKEVKALLAKLVRDGAAVHTGGLWFPRKELEQLLDQALSELRKTGRMGVGAFKDIAGLGRKQVIPLLELLDKRGLTRRDGDDRLPGPKLDGWTGRLD